MSPMGPKRTQGRVAPDFLGRSETPRLQADAVRIERRLLSMARTSLASPGAPGRCSCRPRMGARNGSGVPGLSRPPSSGNHNAPRRLQGRRAQATRFRSLSACSWRPPGLPRLDISARCRIWRTASMNTRSIGTTNLRMTAHWGYRHRISGYRHTAGCSGPQRADENQKDYRHLGC